ncbi:LysE family translocator [Pseudooceanicola sp. LIPI14-2-Ac024]|uniref:LysE family translocator n=1 Tax=Pseudooceanicola sp. LIPI14-2-Ac024 TaxID=3344875 RepID=UPI0035D0B436
MTITASQLAFYTGALVILFFTPGPVWLALTARALSGGFRAAWPLALGVVVGDALWPLLAILGVSWIVSVFDGFMTVLRLVGAAMFLTMGVLLIRNADKTIAADSRLTAPGAWAGFAAGVAVILGNPKAILFYMGVLPGFFDVSAVTAADMAVIVLISMLVPLVGNLCFALFIDRMRRLMTSGRALRRTNITAGFLMILVGCLIPFM